jgi:hypothetical protein
VSDVAKNHIPLLTDSAKIKINVIFISIPIPYIQYIVFLDVKVNKLAQIEFGSATPHATHLSSTALSTVLCNPLLL